MNATGPVVSTMAAPPPLHTRPYDPTTDQENKTQIEYVDVYLLAPEDDRAIELKDFTIMKPKNNKMHRLVRYFPRCEIVYTAAPPPEDKLVTSPHGTTTVVPHRHNGGFSNPSRNAEVFRLKRKLLNQYLADVSADDTVDSSTLRSYKRASSMASSSYAPSPQLPTYVPAPVGDEDTVALTTERVPPMSLNARTQYIDALWPSLAPVDDDDEIMDYYGLEVTIVADDELGVKADNSNSPTKLLSATAASLEKLQTSSAATSPQPSDMGDVDDDNEEREIAAVETRATALQRMKDAELVAVNPVASKQDDWVQCDKCQKWRRLPNHVNVSELPATWYCKMNRWDKRFNKCSAPEEKIAVLLKESDLLEYRERKFALDFLQRIKRMEKALQSLKYSDAKDDDGKRHVVQCVECLKTRPLLGGMDPHKVAQPFVCWMHWDELRASCSAPQSALPSRDFGDGMADAAAAAAVDDANGDRSSAMRRSKSAASKSSSSGDKHEPAAAVKRPAKSSAMSNGASHNNNSVKRKSNALMAASNSNSNASAGVKKPKRR